MSQIMSIRECYRFRDRLRGSVLQRSWKLRRSEERMPADLESRGDGINHFQFSVEVEHDLLLVSERWKRLNC
jgi:hypothetical protein